MKVRQTETERDSAIELLRILAMVMIVAGHFSTFGGFAFFRGFTYAPGPLDVPRLWWLFLEAGGNFGVNIYMLITGYFLAAKKDSRPTLRKIVRFTVRVFFYSLIINLVFLATGQTEITKDFIRGFLPITYETWWYASVYFLIYLLHPWINRLLYSLDKKSYQRLLGILIFFWSVIPTFTLSDFQSNNLCWFLTLYCVAGYIRIHGINTKRKPGHYLAGFLLCYGLRYASSVILSALGGRFAVCAKHNLEFFKMQSVLTFLSALFLFQFFRLIRIKPRAWINIIASSTFGVYLFHVHPLTREFLWQELLHCSQYEESLLIIPYSIFAVAAVFITAAVTDLILHRMIGNPLFRLANPGIDAAGEKLRKLCDRFLCAVFG